MLGQNFDVSFRQNAKYLTLCNIFTYIFAKREMFTLQHVTLS